MALAIRLARGGMKKRPHYRIVVTDSRQPRDGRFIEKLGTYNPLLPKDSAERVKLDGERAAHWLSVGAQPSDRVARFLDAMGIRTRAAKSNLKKGEPGANAKERTEVKATKATEREEAAAALAAAPAPEPEVETVDVEAAPEVETAPEVEPVAEVEAAPVVETAPVEAAPEAAAETETVAETAVEADAPAGEAVEAEVAPAAASDLEATTETDASPAGPAV